MAGPQFHLSQGGIALFALAGVAGAIAAPLAGRLADRGLGKIATPFAMLAVALGFIMTHLAPEGSPLALSLLVAAGIVLDAGVSANLVFGQRAIFMLDASLRSRLNGLYMATFFFGGALGSSLGAYAYAIWGWQGAFILGLALPLVALVYCLTDFMGKKTP